MSYFTTNRKQDTVMSSDASSIAEVKREIGMSDDVAASLLGKRKRTTDDDHNGSDLDDNEEHLVMPDDIFVAPENQSDEENDDGVGSSSDVSSSETEENDMLENPYCESSEPYPKCAVYDTGIGIINKKLRAIPEQVLDVLESYRGTSKHSPKVRIGLLGDAGAGKSSLLNALTDIADLAKSLSGGQSCTCVPTEYTSSFSAQRKTFAASIRYFDIPKIKALFQEMLNDFNLFTFEYDRDWDDEQRTQYKRAMQNALKTFRVLFCDLEQFKNAQAAKEFLKHAWEDQSVQAVEMLMASCEVKLKNKLTHNHGYCESIEASTRAKLRELVDPLMGAKTKGDEPALWPLVRQVVIGIRDCRVLENVTIVDLPGISDTNTLRVELCKEYIKLCDYLWVVAPIKRVVDDSSVYNLLATYGQRFQGKVAVVCTHADESVDGKLATFLGDNGCKVQAYFDDSQKWKKMKKEITHMKKTMSIMRKRKKPTKPMMAEVQTFEDELKALTAECETIDAKRFELLVKERVKLITAQLQEEMQSHMPTGSTLDVFCVSNSHYGAHKGAVKVSGPWLSVPVTGIPALRSHTLALPASLLMGFLSSHMYHTMTVFLKGAYLWVETTNIERRQELLELVQAPTKLLEGRLKKHKESFNAVVKSSVTKSLDTSMQHILEVAHKKFDEKKQKNHSTVRAFVRKDGNHSSKLCPRECWNESFTRAVHQLVHPDGKSWEKDFLSNMATTRGWIIVDLQRVLANIGEQSCATVLPMDKIRELIAAQIIGIESIFDDIIAEYQKDFGNIALDMTQDSDKNYFSCSMKPVYDSCRADTGSGVTKRSLDKLEAHLGKTGEDAPFAVLRRCAVKALLANDEKHINKHLMARINRVYKETYSVFDRMVAKNAVEDPKEGKVRLLLKDAMPKLQGELDSAKKNLLAVKKKYATVVL